jgi:hypothetical protein
MINESTVKLPLREAYTFGDAKGLEAEFDQVRRMQVRWPENTLKYGTITAVRGEEDWLVVGGGVGEGCGGGEG